MIFKKNIFKPKLFFMICLHLNFSNNLISTEYSGYDISALEADAISSASQNNFGSSQNKSEVETEFLPLPEGTDTTVSKEDDEVQISTAAAVGIGIGAAVVLGVFLKWLWNRRKKNNAEVDPTEKDISEFKNKKKTVTDELEKALSANGTSDEFKKHAQYLKKSISNLEEGADDESFKKLLVASENFSDIHLSKESVAGLSKDELEKLKSANSEISKLRKQVVSSDNKDNIKNLVLDEISKTKIPEKIDIEKATVVDSSDETKPLFDPEVKKTRTQRLKDGFAEKRQAIKDRFIKLKENTKKPASHNR